MSIVAEKLCLVDGCDGARVGQKDWCDPHYRRSLDGRPMIVPIPRRSKKVFSKVGDTCFIEDCSESPKTQGYCGAHYARMSRGGDMLAAVRSRPGTPRPKCAVAWCGEDADAAVDGAVCAAHRAQVSRHGEPYSSRTARNGSCLIPDCEEPMFSKGMCGRHSQRASRFGLTFIQMTAIVLQPTCDVCAEVFGGKISHIDHDHGCCGSGDTCGMCIRGILCRGCNHGLGNFQDNPARLAAAMSYLGA